MDQVFFAGNRKNSWWPILVYTLSFVGFYILCITPIVIFYFDLFEGGGDAFVTFSNENPWLNILIQVAFLCATLMASWLTIIKLEESSFWFFGLTFKLRSLLVGFVLGLICILVFSGVVQLFGLVEFSVSQNSVLIFFDIVIFFFVACAEEVFIRGYLLIKIRSKLGDFFALTVTSLLFGFMHGANDHFTWIGFVNITLSGYLMGLLVLKTKTIATAIGLHWSWNLVQGSIFGFSVSGNDSNGFLEPVSLANPMLSGGIFGAEGSVLLIPVTLFLIYLLY